MSASWLVFVGFTVAAILFVVLPLLLRRNDDSQDDEAVQALLNKALYDENLRQLENQRENGEIGDKTFAKLKQELEKQLEQDQKFDTQNTGRLSKTGQRWIYAGAAIFVAVSAVVFYQQWGAQPDWRIFQTNLEKVRLQERGGSEAELRQINKALERMLEQRLRQRDDNLQNWFLLARTYAELEDYKSAMEAYQKILDQQPRAPDVLSEMAQVEYLSNGYRFTAEVQDLFDRAIAMAPQNIRIVSYAALTAYQSGNFQAAAGYWQRAVDMSDPNSQQRQIMLQSLEAARAQLRAAGIELEESEVASGPSLKVDVSIGEELDLNPNYRVFVYARPWQTGMKMPLAIKQDIQVADLPLTVILTDSMVMQPGMPSLSQFDQWELVARVSQSGIANAQSGDWEASVGPITEEESDQTHQLVITSQIP